MLPPMRSSWKTRLTALTVLVVWLGAIHHDVWLAVADLGHHHGHSHSHDHHHGEDKDDQSDSIPLVDLHSVPFISASHDCSKPLCYCNEGPDFPSLWLEHFKERVTDWANAPPDPDWINHSQNLFHSHLANSVQPNAPPSHPVTG